MRNRGDDYMYHKVLIALEEFSRDLLELRARDETSHVIQRVHSNDDLLSVPFRSSYSFSFIMFKGHNWFEILKISIFFLHFSIIYTFKNNIKISSGNLK